MLVTPGTCYAHTEATVLTIFQGFSAARWSKRLEQLTSRNFYNMEVLSFQCSLLRRYEYTNLSLSLQKCSPILF